MTKIKDFELAEISVSLAYDGSDILLETNTNDPEAYHQTVLSFGDAYLLAHALLKLVEDK